MAQHQSRMSITLPRNFSFHSNVDGEPKTPNQLLSELDLPPPPPHSTCRYRRPRLDRNAPCDPTLPSLFASDIPIPSIEVPHETNHGRPTWHMRSTEPSPSDRLHLSTSQRGPPPRTPPAQIKTLEPQLTTPSVWVLERPSSSCSNTSDSSLSSGGTFNSKPSFGGSCTSPESDFQDTRQTRARKGKSVASPAADLFTYNEKLPKRTWTVDMDNHLWNVYQMYLQDPTITPFKTVPGSLPPLGVCHRVAREAKRAWPKASKISYRTTEERELRDVFNDIHAVPSSSPEETYNRSGSSTPTAIGEDIPKVVWPKESATRKRLKELCKRKFSIAPHYQRLLQSRSPSPFVDPFCRYSSISRSSRQSSVSLSRDLNVSLVASTATGPLAQLAAEDSPSAASDEWFNKPISNAVPVEEKEETPNGLGINTSSGGGSDIPRLGSPFMYNTWGPVRSKKNSSRPSLNSFDTIHATGSRLLAPANLDPFSNAHKRRAQYQLEDELSPGGSSVRDNMQEIVFSGSGEGKLSQRRVRLRNRGVTLGAISSREGLDELFKSAPTIPDADTSVLGTDSVSGSDDIKRLGSPFEPDKDKNFRRRSPRHAPSMSDPFITNPFSGADGPSSIGERLALANSDPFITTTTGGEEKISEAERVRRLLLGRR